MASRKPIAEMSPDEIRAWIHHTREALQRKMQRERAYLDRRAARRIHTPTGDTYEAGLLLEADLLLLLDELAASL